MQRGSRIVAPLPTWKAAEAQASGHVVQFYGGPFPAPAVAGFLQQGLAAGEVGVVIASPPHILEVQTQLGGSGRCLFLDAEETLGKFMRDGHPDRQLFLDIVGDVVHQAAELGNGHVRAFGEMVVLLCEQGHPEAAQELEGLWNELGKQHKLKLLCSYPLKAFRGRAKGFEARLRETHSHGIGA